MTVHSSFIGNGQKVKIAMGKWVNCGTSTPWNTTQQLKKKLLILVKTWMNCKGIMLREKKPFPKSYVLCDSIYVINYMTKFGIWKLVVARY